MKPRKARANHYDTIYKQSSESIKLAFEDFNHVMTTNDVKALTGETYGRIRYAIDKGYIVSYKIGHYHLCSRSSVLEWWNTTKRLKVFPLLKVK